ncbi:MAG: hypothetical protein ACKVU0_07635 [Saprospiraceae bacterium]
MIYRFSTLILGAWLTLGSFNLNAQGFSVVIDSVEVQAGDTVCVPVRAKGFVDIIAFQYFLAWDNQVLAFVRTQNFNLPGWSASDFIIYVPTNILVVTWDDPNFLCIDRADGEILYEVCFTAIGALSSSTSIVPTGSGGPPTFGSEEAYNCLGQEVWNSTSNDTGFVKIVASTSTFNAPKNEAFSFQLSPNPTASSAQVVFQSPGTGSTILLVTDALVRIVYEQKATVNMGENRFEIPASALNVKGMYQVSLQTAQGISSKILSVY